MKVFFSVTILLFSMSNIAQATGINRGWSFSAPTIYDSSNVANPSLGDIVFDTSVGAFQGYGNTGWASLGTGGGGTLVTPTIQKFLSGSGTYTTPNSPSPLYIRVRMIGGGGGGAGGASHPGGAGGNSTFGSSLLVANGGSGGLDPNAGTGGSGGTASLGSGPSGIALTGATGGTSAFVWTGSPTIFASGGGGGSSPFGGAGGMSSGTGAAAVNNTGSGGAGGGVLTTSGANSAAGGGGAAGFVDAIINTPSSTYSYSVGIAGTAGAATSSNNAGGAGGSGMIIVEEFYQ